ATPRHRLGLAEGGQGRVRFPPVARPPRSLLSLPDLSAGAGGDARPLLARSGDREGRIEIRLRNTNDSRGALLIPADGSGPHLGSDRGRVRLLSLRRRPDEQQLWRHDLGAALADVANAALAGDDAPGRRLAGGATLGAWTGVHLAGGVRSVGQLSGLESLASSLDL